VPGIQEKQRANSKRKKPVSLSSPGKSAVGETLVKRHGKSTCERPGSPTSRVQKDTKVVEKEKVENSLDTTRGRGAKGLAKARRQKKSGIALQAYNPGNNP